eukprot:g1714.t1
MGLGVWPVKEPARKARMKKPQRRTDVHELLRPVPSRPFQQVTEGGGVLKHLCSVFALLVALLLAVYWKRLIRIYSVVRLFHPDFITHNFRSMTDPHGTGAMSTFPWRTAYNGPKVAQFTPTTHQKNLPQTFTFEGKEVSLEGWLFEVNATALVVLRIESDTKAVLEYERYWLGNDANSHCISWSVGKSVVGTLFGIALHEGLIKSLHDKTTDYLPELQGTGYDDVELLHVLTMSSGVGFDENYGDFHSDINRMGRLMALGLPIAEFAASLKAAKEPGTYLKYVSIDTQVLGLVLSRVLEKSYRTLTQYLQEKLWEPVGMEAPVHWSLDNEANQMELAFGTLHARTRDYARFGWFQMNHGRSPLDGSQLLPADWVQSTCHAESASHLRPGRHEQKDPFTLDLGYGYHWWCPPHPEEPGVFTPEQLAVGVYGQAIYVNFEKRIVIARNAAFARFTQKRQWIAHTNIAAFRRIAAHFASD